MITLLLILLQCIEADIDNFTVDSSGSTSQCIYDANDYTKILTS